METICFLHGALGSSSQFDSLIAELNGDFRCEVLDFPFHGNKSAANHRYENLKWNIHSLTEFFILHVEQHFTEKISVFGYSMGGYIALYAASLRPDLFRNIMTLGTKFLWDETIAEKEIRLLNPEKMQEKIPAFVESLKVRHSLINWKDLIIQTALILKDLGENNILNEERLGLIESDVLLCIGDQDETVTIEETMQTNRYLKQSNIFIFPETKHPFEKINTALLMDKIIRFFNY